MKKLLFLALVLVSVMHIPSAEAYVLKLQEPVGSMSVVAGPNGFSLISNYIAGVYRYMASIVGIICVLYIVFSGIQIILGGANSELVSQAKTRILQSILSLVLLLGTALLLKTVNPYFFGGGGSGILGMILGGL